MSDNDLVKVTQRVYSQDPDSARYVLFYEGQLVKRSILEELGLIEKEPAVKARTKKDVEDKAVKPDTKG